MKLRRAAGRARTVTAGTGDAGTLGGRMSETLASKAPAGAPRGIVASRHSPPDLKLVMATQDLSEAPPADRRRSQPGRQPRRQHRHGAAGGDRAGWRGGGPAPGRPRQRRALYPGAARLPRHGRRVLAVCDGDRHPAPRRQGDRRQPDAQGGGRRGGRRPPGHRSARPRHLRQRRLSRSGRRQGRARRAAGRAGVHRRSRRFGGGLSAAQGGARRPPGPGGGARHRPQGQARDLAAASRPRARRSAHRDAS